MKKVLWFAMFLLGATLGWFFEGFFMLTLPFIFSIVWPGLVQRFSLLVKTIKDGAK